MNTDKQAQEPESANMSKANKDLQILKVSLIKVLKTTHLDVYFDRFDAALNALKELSQIKNVQYSNFHPRLLKQRLEIYQESLGLRFIDRYLNDQGISDQAYKNLEEYQDKFTEAQWVYIESIFANDEEARLSVVDHVESAANEKYTQVVGSLDVTSLHAGPAGNKNKTEEELLEEMMRASADQSNSSAGSSQQPNSHQQFVGCLFPGSGCLLLLLLWILLALLSRR